MDLFLAIIFVLATILVHPFVGLNSFICILGFYLAQKQKTKIKKVFLLIITFITSSLIVFLAFAVYNWLQNKTLILGDPFYYIDYFLKIFAGPAWYVHSTNSWLMWIIYIYERIHYFLIILLIIIYFFVLSKNKVGKKRFLANLFIIVLIFSSLISAWFFISSLEISGYTALDQSNYSYRLVQSSKWSSIIILFLIVINVFQYLRKRSKQWQKILIILLFSIILTVNWYFTYPRNDLISRMNINSIRDIDYQAVNLIYNREHGKEGYFVLANQLFGAAAVQKYGFGPYYKDDSGDDFLYYSIPSGNKLNEGFNHLMLSQEFQKSDIYNNLRKYNIQKVYLITTDYWPLADKVDKQARLEAKQYWNIKNKVFIYYFEL